MELMLTILLYFLLFFVMYSTTKYLFQKLNNLPPSPFFVLPVIGHLHLLKKPMHTHFTTLSKKYGPVFSLQLGSRFVLVVNSPSAVEECFSKNDTIFANRPRLLAGKYLGYNYTSLTWAPYGDHWRNLRRISSTELLSSNRISSLSHIRVDDVRALVRHIFRVTSGNPGNVLEMKTMIYELLFNVMTRMILGKRFYGENTIISEEGKEFQGIIQQMHDIMNVSTVSDFIPMLHGVVKAEEKYRLLYERRDKFFQDLIELIRRKGTNLSSPDMRKTVIEVLLSLHESDPEYYTDELIKSMTSILIQGGSDTSVSTMEWAMSLLLNNPLVLEKAQAEIDSHVGSARLIDDSDIAQFPFLNCIIKETLRLYPIIPLLLPHESSEECFVGGYRIPKGTMLLVNTWAIHHNPAVWDDPFKFKPERFMTTKDSSKIKDEFKHLAFGKGRRGCPGEALAIRMIGLALGSLVQCFNWERISEELEDMSEISGVVITKKRPQMAKCSPRPSMENLLSNDEEM